MVLLARRLLRLMLLLVVSRDLVRSPPVTPLRMSRSPLERALLPLLLELLLLQTLSRTRT
jgi:hypothetical protein